MPTKYQVFVSSTYEDLKDERDQVIKAVLEMGHIPVGMEMFSAADEEQWKIIARHIDESDYYCVILAHRYGSETGGVSFTRKEYEYAVQQGIPVLGFVIDDSASWPASRVDKGEDGERLREFKSLVKQKPISYWSSITDLYGKVSIALAKQITANPRDGWVRASSIAGPEVTAELTRLSAENARLRELVSKAESKATSDRAAEVDSMWKRLFKAKTNLSYKYRRNDPSWELAEGVTHASLFFWLGPSMISEVSVDDAGDSLAMHLRKDKDSVWWTVAYNQVRELFADWMSLGLAEPSNRKHAVSDKNEYWTLTEFGREVLTHIRLRMMERDGGGDGDTAKASAKKASAKKAPAKKASAKKAPAKNAPAT